MKNFLLGLFIGTIIYTAFADKISSPPPLQNEPSAEQHYFQEIYENFHRLEIVTTNPDGSRSGKKGDMLLLQTGGNSYLEINTNSGNQWLGVLLSDTP